MALSLRESIAQSNNSSLNRICSKHTNIQWMEVELFWGFFLTSRESKELHEMSMSIYEYFSNFYCLDFLEVAMAQIPWLALT
jgi:hypothetical protein